MTDRMQNLKSNVIRIAAVALVMAFCFKYMGVNDYTKVVSWWLMLLLLGLIFQPLTLILFRRFRDNGWMFSKTLGIAFSAWLVWFVSSIRLMKFSMTLCVLSVLVCFAANMVLLYLYNRYSSSKIRIMEVFSVEKLNSMINAEIIFFCVFSAWCYIKGFNAAAYGTERFMDYGYVAAILKSDYMPPHDLWFSGNSINYYYVGQFISAYLIRLSDVGTEYGYNLMMMTLAAMGFSLPYSIGSNLFGFYLESRKEKKSSYAGAVNMAGLLAGLSVGIAGNMHFPVFKWIMPRINQILGKENDSYWFADATRYIGYNPKTNDKTIHEFPSYSFILGDLHAHVINIIFVLTLIALLLAWMMNRREKIKNGYVFSESVRDGLLKEIFSPWICVIMFLIGLFHMTNYWDFPIYYVVSGAVILFMNMICYGFKKKAYILTAIQGVMFIIIGEITALPFTLSFESISSACNFTDQHTPLYQLAVLWGLPVFVLILFIVVLIREFVIRERKKASIMPSDENMNGENQKKGLNVVFRFMRDCQPADLFALILGLCALGLVLIPEFIYIVDIYGGAYKRANTMFKLTYQSFIMFGILMSYVIVRLICFKKGIVKRLAVTAAVLLACTVCYFFEATGAWFTGYYKTIDATAFLATESPDDYKGVEWINENVPDDAVVLEMCGLSYSFFNRISVFTGNQTVLGWQTHEWLWRSSGEDKTYPESVRERHSDVLTIYTSSNVKEVMSLIEKYDIDYIYVGCAETFDGYNTTDGEVFHGGNYKKITTNHNLLKSLGEVVMISEADGYTKNYETYIVKIDRTKEADSEYIYAGEDNEVSWMNNRPEKIVRTDAGGNSVGYSELKYDSNGMLTHKTDYKEDVISGFFICEYDGRLPKIGKNLDSDGNLSGFWNYPGTDEEGRVNLMHYFDANEKWVKSLKIVYNSGGMPVQITKTDSDYNEMVISFVYDTEGKLLNLSYTDSDGEHVFSTVYNEKVIFSILEYCDGEMLYQYDFVY